MLKKLGAKDLKNMTNDSVVLATVLRLGAEVLVSADAAFQQTSEPVVASPSDLRI